MKEKLLEALPIFIGATLGVYFYASVLPPAVILLCLVVLALVGVLAGWEARQRLPSHPVLAVRLWQVQAVLPMSLLAAGGYLIAAGLAHLPALIALVPFVDLPADAVEQGKRIDTISAALATAVTTFCGALVMDDLEKGTGGWWPPAQIKQAFAATFGRWSPHGAPHSSLAPAKPMPPTRRGWRRCSISSPRMRR